MCDWGSFHQIRSMQSLECCFQGDDVCVRVERVGEIVMVQELATRNQRQPRRTRFHERHGLADKNQSKERAKRKPRRTRCDPTHRASGSEGPTLSRSSLVKEDAAAARGKEWEQKPSKFGSNAREEQHGGNKRREVAQERWFEKASIGVSVSFLCAIRKKQGSLLAREDHLTSCGNSPIARTKSIPPMRNPARGARVGTLYAPLRSRATA
jgi:hypothetical protein